MISPPRFSTRSKELRCSTFPSFFPIDDPRAVHHERSSRRLSSSSSSSPLRKVLQNFLLPFTFLLPFKGPSSARQRAIVNDRVLGLSDHRAGSTSFATRKPTTIFTFHLSVCVRACVRADRSRSSDRNRKSHLPSLSPSHFRVPRPTSGGSFIQRARAESSKSKESRRG